MTVRFKVIGGKGSVDDSVVITNEYGYAYTRWKSGNSAVNQSLQAKIYSVAGKYLGTQTYTGSAFMDNIWNQFTDNPEMSIHALLGDTIHQQSLMVSGCNLYKQTGNYFNWEIVNSGINCPTNIWMCSDGTIFLLANGWTIYKSTDGGQTWSQCSTLMPEYYANIVVSPNKYIWASLSNSGLQCSRDGGLSWTIDTIGIGKQQLVDIYRLSNGTWLLQPVGWQTYKSTDDGKTWTPFASPDRPLKLFVTPDDQIIYCTQLDGFSIFKSTDLGATYNKVYSAMPVFSGWMGKTFYKFKDFWYVLIPGYGVVKTKDFTNYSTLWNNGGAYDMYLDHNGVILIRDFLNHFRYYYRGT